MSDGTVIPNLVQEDLKILFIGINPGLRSAEVGHHFAGRSNRFWRFLYESGLTTSKLRGEEDSQLLEYGYGITNIIHRPTAAAAELRPEEFQLGAKELSELIGKYQPRIAAYLGKDIYKAVSHRKEAAWGVQPSSIVAGVIDFLLPNPSGLNRMTIGEQLCYYQQLHNLLHKTNFSPAD